jgi:hypothetical protein
MLHWGLTLDWNKMSRGKCRSKLKKEGHRPSTRLSGWTAQSMAQAADQDGIGIRAILRKADANVRASDSDREVAGVAGVPEEKRHTITACIIIAGTNDLGTTSSHEEVGVQTSSL